MTAFEIGAAIVRRSLARDRDGGRGADRDRPSADPALQERAKVPGPRWLGRVAATPGMTGSLRGGRTAKRDGVAESRHFRGRRGPRPGSVRCLGENPMEAARVVAGELPDLPYHGEVHLCTAQISGDELGIYLRDQGRSLSLGPGRGPIRRRHSARQRDHRDNAPIAGSSGPGSAQGSFRAVSRISWVIRSALSWRVRRRLRSKKMRTRLSTDKAIADTAYVGITQLDTIGAERNCGIEAAAPAAMPMSVPARLCRYSARGRTSASIWLAIRSSSCLCWRLSRIKSCSRCSRSCLRTTMSSSRGTSRVSCTQECSGCLPGNLSARYASHLD